MLKIVTDKKQISSLHERFHNQLDKYLTEKIQCWVGYPSGSFEDTVKYSSELNVWISNNELENRFWNGFGIGRPIEGRNNSLNGEINFPYEGYNRRIAGVFAIDENGTVLVLHRGKIGGGKPGIGKNYFIENFRGDSVIASDGNGNNEFCLVGELDSIHFPQQVANFIHEIYRVKHIEIDETKSIIGDLENFKYTEEHFGNTVTERSDPTIIERTHGIVVNALANELEKLNFKIGNDRNRDLFTHNNGKIINLFEIKTTSSTQCLYSAVGQLLIYSIPIKTDVNLIAVLPNKLSDIVERKLLSLNIKTLYYNWKNNEPVFIELASIF